MSEMVQIRSIKDYFQEFGVEGIGKGAKVEMVRQQIKDAFRKEVFDQIIFKTHVADISEVEETKQNREMINNIMKNSYKKWVGLIRKFNQYRETYNLLKPDDLVLFEEEAKMYDPLDGFDDEEETTDADEGAEEKAKNAGGLAESADGPGEEPEGTADAADEAVSE